MKKIISQEKLKELVVYDKDTGIFTHNKKHRRFNIGDKAGYIAQNGYVFIGIDKTQYRAHRLAFLYVNGYMPENEVDHINWDRADNRWSNLRETSHQCNMRNCKIKRHNKSGVTGISFDTTRNKWSAFLRLNNKSINLGRYINFRDAVTARLNAEKEHNYFSCVSDSPAYRWLMENPNG